MQGSISRKRFVLALLLTLLALAGKGTLSAIAGEPSPTADKFIMLGKPYAALPQLANPDSAPPYSTDYTMLPVSEKLPKDGEFYHIHPTVSVAGYSYFFDVDGIDMDYEVGSSINLVKLVHELGVIEELKRKHKGKEFAEGVAEGVKGIGTGVVNLVTAPGQSFREVGNKLRRTGRSIERTVTSEGKVGEDARGHDRSLLGSGPAGQARRALAHQFGVDVYTSNPVLQKLLTDLSHAQTAGTLTTWMIPFVISAFGYFNPMAGDEATELRIRDNDPHELRRLIGLELEPVLQMDREDKFQPLNKMLMNPNYSPRDLAYIGMSLMQMQRVKMLPRVVGELAGVSSPEEADMMALSMRLFGLLNRNIQPLVGFAKYKALLAGLGADGIIYVMYPGDILGPWDTVNRSFDKLLQDKVKRGMNGIEVWVLGDVQPDLVADLEQKGGLVRQHILRDTRFFSPAVTAAQEGHTE